MLTPSLRLAIIHPSTKPCLLTIQTRRYNVIYSLELRCSSLTRISLVLLFPQHSLASHQKRSFFVNFALKSESLLGLQYSVDPTLWTVQSLSHFPIALRISDL